MASQSDTEKPKGPGRPGLSFEQYQQAYHALSDDSGNPPSQRQLRRYLGTGNNNTLAKYRRRVAEERLGDDRPAEPGTLDAELLATVHKLASQIALDEAQVAEDRVDEIRKEAEQRVHVAEATLEKRLKDTDLLEYRATSAEASLAELKKKTKQEASSSADRITGLRDELQTLKEQNAALLQAKSDATRQLDAQLQSIDKQQIKLDMAASEAEAMKKSSQENMAALQRKLAESEQDNATLAEKYAGLAARFEQQAIIADKQSGQIAACSAELQDTRSANRALHQKNAELSGLLDTEKRVHQATIENAERAVADKATLVEELQLALKVISEKPNHNKKGT